MGLAVGLLLGAIPDGDCRASVERILDSWTNRAAARAVLPPDGECLARLGDVAGDGTEGYQRRSRAVSLLATVKSPASVAALRKIAEDPDPAWRCRALQALAEIGSEEVVPILVARLEDRAVCMTVTASHTAREQPVFVSDEAVRALETVTGLSFGSGPRRGGHRDPNPWRKWWRKKTPRN